MISHALASKIEELVVSELEKDGWVLTGSSSDMMIFEKGEERVELLNSYEWFSLVNFDKEEDEG